MDVGFENVTKNSTWKFSGLTKVFQLLAIFGKISAIFGNIFKILFREEFL